MATVNVKITDRAVIRAVSTPGGPGFEFMDTLADQIEDGAFRRSPVNNPANAMHRGGVTGTYKASWSWDRRGTGFHGIARRVLNSSGHASVVEYGRSMSQKFQVFSWTAWGGQIRYIRRGGPFKKKPKDEAQGRLSRWVKENDMEFGGRKTAARAGRFILTAATNAALVRNGLRPGL